MDKLLEKIEEAIREFLEAVIFNKFEDMFTDVNDKVGTIATEVGKTPSEWNGTVFGLIQNVTETAIIPIAGLIITFVLCYELIQMIMEKNNMHDFDTFMFFKWVFKAWVAVFMVTHTFDISMAVFDVSQSVINNSSSVISGGTAIEADTTAAQLLNDVDSMETGDMFLLMLETLLCSTAMDIMAVIITIILYGRMIEIYMYCSISPIPFATITNKEWGNIGTNYIRSLFALGFQGFFMMICVGIYAALITTVTQGASDLHTLMFSVLAMTVMLCFALFKTGSLAKSVFNAH